MPWQTHTLVEDGPRFLNYRLWRNRWRQPLPPCSLREWKNFDEGLLDRRQISLSHNQQILVRKLVVHLNKTRSSLLACHLSSKIGCPRLRSLYQMHRFLRLRSTSPFQWIHESRFSRSNPNRPNKVSDPPDRDRSFQVLKSPQRQIYQPSLQQNLGYQAIPGQFG